MTFTATGRFIILKKQDDVFCIILLLNKRSYHSIEKEYDIDIDENIYELYKSNDNSEYFSYTLYGQYPYGIIKGKIIRRLLLSNKKNYF